MLTIKSLPTPLSKHVVLPALVFLLAFTQCAVDLEMDLLPNGCQGACVSVEGRLTTGNGSEPLAYQTIEVYYDTRILADLAMQTGEYRLKARSQTDEDGNYFLNFSMSEDELQNPNLSYEVIVSPDNETFHCVHHGTNGFKVSPLEDWTGEDPALAHVDLIQNWYVPRQAKLLVKPKGTYQIQEGESLRVEVTSYYGDDLVDPNLRPSCKNFLLWEGLAFNSKYVWVAAEQNIPVTTTITRADGTTATTTEYVYLEPGEEHPMEASFSR